MPPQPINNRTILIGRCSYEKVVKYPYYWMERIIAEAKKLNFEVIQLNNEDFRRDQLIRFLKEKQPFMVILCGHGSEYFVQGHNNEKVMELCKEDYLLKDKIAYVISCGTAKELSKSAKAKGCKNYIGWDNKLEIPVRKNSTPEQDEYAQPCMEALTQLPISILNGNSVQVAYKECYDKLDEWIKKWRADMKFSVMASMLEEIRDHLVVA